MNYITLRNSSQTKNSLLIFIDNRKIKCHNKIIIPIPLTLDAILIISKGSLNNNNNKIRIYINFLKKICWMRPEACSNSIIWTHINQNSLIISPSLWLLLANLRVKGWGLMLRVTITPTIFLIKITKKMNNTRLRAVVVIIISN